MSDWVKDEYNEAMTMLSNAGVPGWEFRELDSHSHGRYYFKLPERLSWLLAVTETLQAARRENDEELLKNALVQLDALIETAAIADEHHNYVNSRLPLRIRIGSRHQTA